MKKSLISLAAFLVLLGTGAALIVHSQNIGGANSAGKLTLPGLFSSPNTNATSFNTNSTSSTATRGTPVGQNATKVSSFYLPYSISTLNGLGYALTVADNTANVYDIGIYGPNCNAGNTSVPLVAHTGATAGTTFAPSTGVFTIALTGAPVAVSMIPGWYCFAITSSAANPAADFAGDTISSQLMQFSTLSTLGATGTTSGGVLNPTITAPATSISIGPIMFFAGY